MMRLKTLLSDSSKAKRNRRHTLNIQITFLAWLVEFFGFFLIVLGSFILGHENSIVTMVMQTLTMSLFMIILPCIVLLNSTSVKAGIVESRWYLSLSNFLGCQTSKTLTDDEMGCNNDDAR